MAYLKDASKKWDTLLVKLDLKFAFADFNADVYEGESAVDGFLWLVSCSCPWWRMLGRGGVNGEGKKGAFRKELYGERQGESGSETAGSPRFLLLLGI